MAFTYVFRSRRAGLDRVQIVQFSEAGDFFEVDDRHIAHAALAALREDGEIGGDIVDKAVKVLGLDVTGEDPDKR